MLLSDVRGILFGLDSLNLRRLARLPLYDARAAPAQPSSLLGDLPEQCFFSVVTSSRTVDLCIAAGATPDTASRDPEADPVVSWILGLQALLRRDQLILVRALLRTAPCPIELPRARRCGVGASC